MVTILMLGENGLQALAHGEDGLQAAGHGEDGLQVSGAGAGSLLVSLVLAGAGKEERWEGRGLRRWSKAHVMVGTKQKYIGIIKYKIQSLDVFQTSKFEEKLKW